MKIFLKEERQTSKGKAIYDIDIDKTGECCEQFGYLIHWYPTRKLTCLNIENYKEKPEMSMRFCGIEDPVAQLAWSVNFCPYCGEKFELVEPKRGLELFSDG